MAAKTMKTTVEITALKNTPIVAPVLTNYSLPGQKLRHISVGIPPGHAALAGIQISVPGYGVIIPGQSSNVSYIRGENDRIEFEFDINLDPPRNTIQIATYNNDVSLDHTFILNIDTEIMQ